MIENLAIAVALSLTVSAAVCLTAIFLMWGFEDVDWKLVRWICLIANVVAWALAVVLCAPDA